MRILQAVALAALALQPADCQPSLPRTTFSRQPASPSISSGSSTPLSSTTIARVASAAPATESAKPARRPQGWVNYTHLGALPANASKACFQFQPYLEFDDESCFNTPAVDSKGNLDQGLPSWRTTRTLQCREDSLLAAANNNVYCRRRCNNGWCAYMYDYYFPKDVATKFGNVFYGHTHEWENVVVWTRNPDVISSDLERKDPKLKENVRGAQDVRELADWEPVYICTAQFGRRPYLLGDRENRHWIRTHPAILYTPVTVDGHALMAIPSDSENHADKNKTSDWAQGAVVEYDGFPRGVRDKMLNKDWGKAKVAVKDGEFEHRLYWAMPAATWDVFDPSYDAYPFLPQRAVD